MFADSRTSLHSQSIINLSFGDIIQCDERHKFTMLAHRIDQENVVHGQQTAAAAKSLNEIKTPATKVPKTPFRGALNDENAAVRAGKSILKTNGKGQENFATFGKKGQQLDKSAFVTPAGKLHLTLSEKCHDHSLSNFIRSQESRPSGFQNNQCQSHRISDTSPTYCQTQSVEN